jgi:hypothetical protein
MTWGRELGLGAWGREQEAGGRGLETLTPDT